MTEAFNINNVERGTIKMTAPIAELKNADPDTFLTLKYNPASETLAQFAQKCASHMKTEKKAIVEDMKSKGKLPLLIQY